MNKKSPKNDLEKVKELAEKGEMSFTNSARDDAFALGFSAEGMKDAIINLDPASFNKYEEDSIFESEWQDAYWPVLNGVRLYIKLKIRIVNGKVLVLSFKKNER